jgi:hypothetical protein
MVECGVVTPSASLGGDDEVGPVVDEGAVEGAVGLVRDLHEVLAKGGAAWLLEAGGRGVGRAVVGEEEVRERLRGRKPLGHRCGVGLEVVDPVAEAVMTTIPFVVPAVPVTGGRCFEDATAEAPM